MKKEKNKNVDEALKIIEKIINYNKNTKKYFQLLSKVDKGKSEQKTGESIAERVKLKNVKIVEIKKEAKNINNKLFKYYFSKYQNPSDMYKKIMRDKR